MSVDNNSLSSFKNGEIKVASYRTVKEWAQGEITEKKSRFICDLYHIESEQEIKDLVEALKKKHYQARHVCHAAILGDEGDILKYSDDGEPGGTAGRPMLDILSGKQLTYTLACVTRYFGGVLLGTGGLVRAYSDALEAAIDNAEIITKQLCKKLAFDIDYQVLGKVKYILDKYDAKIISEEYGSLVNITLALPEMQQTPFITYLNELTGGQVNVEDGGMVVI